MKNIITALILGLFSLSCYANTSQSYAIDSVTGAGTWKIHNQGVNFSLTQILPEQAQAFYVNRGFTLKQIKPYSSSCVYMAVLRNDNAPGTIHFESNKWSVFVNGQSRLLKSVDSWVQQLTTSTTKKSALIAFRWAQFPPEQEYEPGGDWNQGMLSIGLAPGSQFDIVARWDIDGKPYNVKLRGVRCVR